MTDSITRRSWDGRLFAVVWLWIAFRTIVPWLVTFRLTLERAGYSWGSDYFGHQFHSSGLARPDFLLITHCWPSVFPGPDAQAASLQAGGAAACDLSRNLRRGCTLSAHPRRALILEGDTLGLQVNLTILFFILQFGMFAVAIFWWFGIRDLSSGPGTPPLSERRKAVFKVCLAAIPVQIFLLVVGKPHALTDKISVLLTIANWFVLMWVFYPKANYRSE